MASLITRFQVNKASEVEADVNQEPEPQEQPESTETNDTKDEADSSHKEDEKAEASDIPTLVPTKRESLTASTQTADDVISKLDPARKERLGRRLKMDARGLIPIKLPKPPAVGTASDIERTPAGAILTTAKNKLTELSTTVSAFARGIDLRKWERVGLSLMVVLLAIVYAAIMYRGILHSVDPKYTQRDTPTGHAESTTPDKDALRQETQETATQTEDHAHDDCGHDHGDHAHGEKEPPSEEEIKRQEQEIFKMFGVNSREELEKLFKQPEPEPEPEDQGEAAEPEDLSEVDFIAAEEFDGPKEGYYFRTDVQGTGYYKEKSALSEGSQSEPVHTHDDCGCGHDHGHAHEEAPVEEEPELEMGDLSKLRIKQLKRIINKAGMDHSTLMEKPEFVKLACQAREKLTAAA